MDRPIQSEESAMERIRRLLDRDGSEPVTDCRPARPSDAPALMELEAAARWAYATDDAEKRAELLAGGLSRVWPREGRLHAAVLAGAEWAPVALLRAVMARSREALAPFLAGTLPALERDLAEAGAQWSAIISPPDWLARALGRHGYAAFCDVVVYRLESLTPGVLGNPDILIREATTADWAAILTVDEAAFEPFWRYPPALVGASLIECPQRLVAIEGGTVVGYLFASRHAGRMHIDRLGVHPRWQGHGVGLRLMTTALDSAYRDGATTATLNTQADNYTSRRLYERLGFGLTPQHFAYWAHPLAALTDKDCVT
jgi:ribosomal protein S18 acetylase RimI-like enzyme